MKIDAARPLVTVRERRRAQVPSRPFRVAALLALGLAAAGLSRSAEPQSSDAAKATFAGGCFWCMQESFENLPGVLSTTAGFAGGKRGDPAAGASGPAESVEILYDPSRITYERLLDIFWHNIDPLTADGQFCDHGRQYRAAIFFHDNAQRQLAEESKRRVEEELHAKVVTEIAPATAFSQAPDSQQNFYKKNPLRYHEYVEGCGRRRRLEQIWGGAAGRGRAKP
jgi:peptide-methionine (S)-S-oxide reductase